MVTVQPASQEIPAAMPGSPSASERAVLRQCLWQEPYAVVLQVRICAGGRQVTEVPTATVFLMNDAFTPPQYCPSFSRDSEWQLAFNFQI